MKIFLYRADRTSPFPELYERVEGKPIISNDRKYVDDFEKYKGRLMGLVNEESVLFVPMEVKERFRGWLEEKYPRLDWEEEAGPTRPECEILGAEEFRNWFQSIEVPKGWEITNKRLVLQQQGQQAEENGDLKTALECYRRAKLDDKATEIERKIQDFENFLNSTAENSEIDTIFVYSLKNSRVLFHSHARIWQFFPKSLSEDTAPKVAMQSLDDLFGELEGVNQMLNEFGEETNRGGLKSTILSFEEGFLGLSHLESFKLPMVLGFIVTSGGLGSLIFYSNQIVNAIETKLKEVTSLKRQG